MWIRVPFEDYNNFHIYLTDGSNLAMVMGTQELNHVQYLTTAKFVVVKEKILSDLEGIFLQPKSFIFDSYHDKAVQLVESGIVEYNLAKSKSKKQVKSSGPVALSIDHLLIWFQLWAGLLLVAVLFFLAEVLSRKFQKF
jgi:hypothetical protein